MEPQPLELIASRILLIRSQRVMIDADLAQLYGVPTKVLNQAVKRNRQRFPSDFMFQLTVEEKADVVTNCDHLNALKFSKAPPFAFTEHGAIQAANVLNSPEAIGMGVLIVRAFVRLRTLVASHKELEQRLAELEQQLEYRLDRQDETIEQIMTALRQLMTQPAPHKRPIGFIHPKTEDD
ncbi:MAG: ORF6N domain-containing protein [Pseudomonadales bacterium]